MQELENLCKQVNDHEIELRGRHSRTDWEGSFDDLDYEVEKPSRGSGSPRFGDRSCETMAQHDESPYHGWHGHSNMALDGISQALRRVARSPFLEGIECMVMLR